MEEEEGVGYTIRQDQEHTVTREHAGGRGGRLLGKSKSLSLTLYYSTTLLLRQRPHTLHTSGRHGQIQKRIHLPTWGALSALLPLEREDGRGRLT